MAVSLNKLEKVDLSKPVLPRKLPEYTPIHLIDEEETIVNRPSRAVRSNVRLQVEKSQSDEIIPDSTPKDVGEIQPHNRKRLIIGIVLAIAVVLAVSLILLNLPNDFFQELSKAFEDSQDIYGIFSFIASNPIFKLLLVISFVGFALHLIHKVCSIFIRR